MMIYRLICVAVMVTLGLLPCWAQAQINLNADITIAAKDSLNNNDVLIGDLEQAFQFQYQYTHQFEHQVNLPETFSGFVDSTAYMPIANVHLEHVNTGISTGDDAGASGGGILAGVNLPSTSIAGMVGMSTNRGGVSQNQSTVNAATAFSR